MSRLFRYLHFLFYSTNQHGVHSPFVYLLVTKGFYNTHSFLAYKHLKFKTRSQTLKARLVYKVLNYFKFTAIYQNSPLDKCIEKALQVYCKAKTIPSAKLLAQIYNPEPADCFIFNNLINQTTTLKQFNSNLEFSKNNTLFIFNNINKCSSSKKSWEAIKNHPKVTVSINTFCVGFIFIRKEQVKQHFIIRP